MPTLSKAVADALIALDVLAAVMQTERAAGRLSEELEREYAVLLNDKFLRILMHGGVNGTKQKDN